MAATIQHILFFMILTGCCVAGEPKSGSFAKESFTEDDFAQFFSLIEDGKIPAAKISERCQKQGIGFTFLGSDIEHDQQRQRVFYNVSQEDSSVDGRTLRAKHFNASFGEWTGSVFKPLCPGMYSIMIDYSMSAPTEVAIYLRRTGEERPGKRILSSNNGHLTIALPLRSMDEISTWTESTRPRIINQITFTAIKVQHLEDYVTDVDMDQFSDDIALLKRTAKD